MLQTTGIGSLPHHNVDAAIEYAFSFDMPFYPQIPLRHAGEFMIAQALESLPGASFDESGAVTLTRGEFMKGREEFLSLLDRIIAGGEEWIFPPEHFSCWTPFLFELAERGAPQAKTQMAGPLTCQWVMSGSSHLDPEVGPVIAKLITAKALTMVRQMKAKGATPVFFLDEPALYSFNPQDPLHKVALQDLKFLAMSLRKEGALVGLHCCSNTDWKTVLGLGLDVVSFDVALSLESVLSCRTEAENFIGAGGMFSLGVIPTNVAAGSVEPRDVATRVDGVLRERLSAKAADQVLKHSWLTPACGLAFKSIEESADVLRRLREVKDILCR